MESIWRETVTIPKRNPLPGNIRTDVAVIGAGMAGILIGYMLQRQGKQVLVLEADRIGSGQTSGTTAKITSQHGMIYDRLIREVGWNQARQYAGANQKAISEYRRLIKRHHISCHFEEKPAYVYSTQMTEPLRREAEAAKALGIPAAFVRETVLPFSVYGAVRFDRQAQFHPLEFIRDVSAVLTVYEQTRVLSVRGRKVETNRGTVIADQVVFACHYPFINFPGFYFARMYQERSYVLALSHAQDVEGMYVSADKGGYSFRNSGSMLLMGGENHRTGKGPAGNPYKRLSNAAKHLWINASVAAHWSAQDCMTLDGVPYIGRFGASTPNWYVATGFRKWGMTTSMAAALILSDEMMGRRSPYADVFSPQRFRPLASAKELASHSAISVAGLSASALPGVVRCPHMGCRLRWNSADKTWDCPCHGSRFQQNGEILADPAQESIPFIN